MNEDTPDVKPPADSAAAPKYPTDHLHSWIQKTPGVCGGDACVRHMRIPVWQLVEMRQAGTPDYELLNNYPLLTSADLAAAWAYYGANKEEIDNAIALEKLVMELPLEEAMRLLDSQADSNG